MPRFVPLLGDLVHQGFHSGLRWETKGSTVETQHGLEHTYRSLLNFPGVFQIAKALAVKLGSTDKSFINHVLAELYGFAAENVGFCADMTPEDFFGIIRMYQAWCADIDKDTFWSFTRRLLHARALFLDMYDPTRGPAPSNALTLALDRFRDVFFARYDPASEPTGKVSHTVRQTHRRFNAKKRDEYFGLASADCEGDGTDRVVKNHLRRLGDDPISALYNPEEPPSEEEEVIGFYYDEGRSKPTYGHTHISS